MERRRKRESFTQSLRRIAQRIDAQKVFELSWKSNFFWEEQRSRLRIKSLWVVGSYARGALECGDLDLVAEISTDEGKLPLTPAIFRVVLGRPADVRLYVGTPDENTSGVAFPEAKLVWSEESPDWDSAIKAIPVTPTATRYLRRTDVLPVRREQVVEYGGDIDILESIVDLTERQIIAWQWIPLVEINVQSSAWSEEAKSFLTRSAYWSGKKTQDLMPFIIEWAQQYNCNDIWRHGFAEKTRFKLGGIEAFVGRPVIQLELLDSLSCSAIAIVPHQSCRGPNGLWILSRGVKHPTELLFAERGAYYLAYRGHPDTPNIVNEIDDWRSINLLELFRSKKVAKTFIDECYYDCEIDLEVVYISGKGLLQIMSNVDVVEIDSMRFAVTNEGKFFDKAEKLVDAESLVSYMCRRPGKRKELFV